MTSTGLRNSTLFDYARTYSEAYEARFADALVECFERLAEYPYSGRARPELVPELRSTPVPRLKVMVYYFPAAEGRDRVRIVRVLRQERHRALRFPLIDRQPAARMAVDQRNATPPVRRGRGR